MNRWTRALAALAFCALGVTMLAAGGTRVQDAARVPAAQTAHRPANVRGPVTCQSLQPAITRGGFTDPIFIMSDAEILPGSNGARVCVYWDLLAEAYSVHLINQRDADQWRATKAQFLPLLEGAGVNPCQIGFFSPVTRDVIKGTNFNDYHDVGRTCDPEVIAHGPKAEARLGEMQAALDAARAKAEELFGWRNSWPLRVFLYDDELAFSEGTRADGRYPRGEPANSKAASRSIFNSEFMTVITVDLKKLENQELLSWMTAKQYFYVVQGGVIGSPWFLPEFVTVGSADYFAMQTLGEDHPAFAIMFQLAVAEALSGRADPLSRHVRAAGNGGSGYLRGFVAMRYLDYRWGPHAWINLMFDNVNGSPDRYLFNFSRLTELTVDEFDRDMNEWLRGFRHLLPTPTPRPTRTPVPRT
jgi:hypothetical protein